MKKERRIGTLTFGIVLVVIGILICVSLFTNIIDMRIILKFWPLVLVILGVEILICSLNKEIQIKYDVWGILLTLFIVFSTCIAGVASYFVNDVIFNNDFKTYIDEKLTTRNYRYYLDGSELTIENSGNVIKKVVINEDKKLDENKVYIEVKTKNNKYFESDDYRHLIFYDYDNKVLNIISGNEEKNIEDGVMTIYTPDANNIKIKGNNMQIIK